MRARLTADTRWSLSSRVVKLWECKGLSLVAATSLCPSHRDLPPAGSPRCRLLCCSERLSLLCALCVMQLQFQHRVSHRKHVNRRRRLWCARARPCSRNLPLPPANGRTQSSMQSTTLKAAAAPAKCPRKYTEGSGRALQQPRSSRPRALAFIFADAGNHVLMLAIMWQVQRVRGVARAAALAVLPLPPAPAPPPPQNRASFHRRCAAAAAAHHVGFAPQQPRACVTLGRLDEFLLALCSSRGLVSCAHTQRWGVGGVCLWGAQACAVQSLTPLQFSGIL